MLIPEFRVFGPEYAKRFVSPHVSGAPGVYQLRYLGTTVPCVPGWGTPLNPGDVAAVIDQMQWTLPLGVIGDLELLVTDVQLLATNDPASDVANAVAAPGFVAFSWSTGKRTLLDLANHEITHRLDALLSSQQRSEFWAIVGQEPGDRNDPVWRLRPQERFAEYVSAAIWDVPIDSTMPQLSRETLALIRRWAERHFAGGDRVTVRLMTDTETPTPEPQARIILTPGSTTATVNGQEHTLDVPPQIVNGRTMVPIRFVGEALNLPVHWDGTHAYVGGIVLTPGSMMAVVNGRERALDAAPLIVEQRLLVPVRFIAEVLGYPVNWDGVRVHIG